MKVGKARALNVAAGILALVALVCFLARSAHHQLGLGTLQVFIVIAVGTFAFVYAAVLRTRAKSLVASDVATVRARDPRPPVVYLREFVEDARRDVGDEMWGYSSSLEEALVRAVAHVGPTIALCRPGEKLPPPGAARQFASNDEWRAVVEKWLQEAKLVLLVASNSKNVAWEIERCVKLLRPESLVLVVPGGQARYAAFREVSAHLFPYPLPEKLGSTGLIVFDREFVPRFLPDRTTWAQRGNRMGGNQYVLWQTNLKPVLDALGVPTRTPPAFSRAFLVAVAVVVVIAAFSVALFVFF